MSEIHVIEPVKPLVTPEQAKQQWQQYEELKKALLGEEDYQAIQGKQYIKKSGFRKIAVFFGLSDEILEQERNDRDDGSFYWRIVAKVTAPNGRSNTGVGMCDSLERNFAHLEHDVYATAHTRAKNRAISDMVAGGAVSAEEMTDVPKGVERGKTKRHEAPTNTGGEYPASSRQRKYLDDLGVKYDQRTLTSSEASQLIQEATK